MRPGKLRGVALAALVLLHQAAGAGVAFATPQTPPIRLDVTVVDARTGAARNSFYLGEPVSVVFSFTNQSGAAQTMPAPEQAEILVKISATLNRSEQVQVREGVRGGRSGSYVEPDGTVVFTEVPRRTLTLAPGQRAEVRINDLARFNNGPLGDGSYVVTATCGGAPEAQAAFSVAVDEARSVPVLERLAAGADDGEKRWANSYLGLIRQPSVSGVIADAAGAGVAGATVYVTGSENANVNTRADGKYDLTHLVKGGSYTLRPALEGYTFEPAQRTVSNLNTRMSGVNFLATRVRTGTDVAANDAGTTAVASSTTPVRRPARGKFFLTRPFHRTQPFSPQSSSCATPSQSML